MPRDHRAPARHWVALSCLLSSACGYHTVTTPKVLQQHQPLYILAFIETPSTGLSAPMAMHLSTLLAAEGLSLTAQAGRSQAHLEGTVQVLTTPSASRAGIQSYQLHATVSARLLDATDTPLWAGQVLVREDFLPDPGLDNQPLVTERNRNFAVAHLAQRAARALYELMVVELDREAHGGSAH
jgi:outer membrane lipopolysaccharide assembly protein LptE/RlpB